MLFDNEHRHQVVHPPPTTVVADIYDNALLAKSRRHKFGLKALEAGPAHGSNVKITEPAIRVDAHQIPLTFGRGIIILHRKVRCRTNDGLERFPVPQDFQGYLGIGFVDKQGVDIYVFSNRLTIKRHDYIACFQGHGSIGKRAVGCDFA